jgi:translation initiation factor 2 subunit 2
MSEFAENPTADDLGVPDDVAAMFDLTQKKKKKKSKKVEVTEGAEQSNDADQNSSEAAAAGSASDMDPPQYSYSQLLNRVVDYLHLNNPDLIEKRRYTMKPPQLMRGKNIIVLAAIFNFIARHLSMLEHFIPNNYFISHQQIVGTKKTLWVNFQEICNTMKRNPEHLFQFMMAELGTEGSIDGNKRLVIRGKFVPKVSRIPKES